MSNALLPSLPGVAWVGRTTFYADDVQESASGSELRLVRYAGPRYRYEYEVRFLRDAYSETSALLDHFAAHGGRRESFWLYDPLDGATRRVRFDEPEMDVRRLAASIYEGGFELVSLQPGMTFPPLDGSGALDAMTLEAAIY